MSKELINKTEKPEYFQELIKTASGDHFVKEEHWIDSKEPGYGISLSVNKTVIPLEYKKKIQDFKEENSLSELIKHGFIENVTIEIYRIIGDYLSINIKSKSINTSAGISVLFEYITEECGNLELQEINFIFKSGIMGKFGVIYNDISIDTICGKEGWIETYYKDFRKFRPEKKQEEVIRLTGKEMTLEDFHAKNPEYKLKYDLHGIYYQAKRYKTTIEDAKQFYLIKGLSLDDFKDDFQFYSKEYQNQKLIKGEMLYITERFRKFIIENVFKNKK